MLYLSFSSSSFFQPRAYWRKGCCILLYMVFSFLFARNKGMVEREKWVCLLFHIPYISVVRCPIKRFGLATSICIFSFCLSFLGVTYSLFESSFIEDGVAKTSKALRFIPCICQLSLAILSRRMISIVYLVQPITLIIESNKTLTITCQKNKRVSKLHPPSSMTSCRLALVPSIRPRTQNTKRPRPV